MGKKKKEKKGLMKKTDTDIKSIVSLLIHGDEDHTTKETKDLLDDEYYFDPERMANVIMGRVERGESAAEIAYYRHDVLKAVCAHVQIPGRAEFTRKKEMAVALVKHFGGKKKQWKNV